MPAARIPTQPYRLDFGPRWNDGIIEVEPPTLGKPFTVLVPRVDRFGNDAAGIRSIELRVPLASYLPWRLRTGMPSGTDRLISFTGTFVPLPRTEQERTSAGDARPSIESLYPSREAFLKQVDAAAAALVGERFLLQQDVAAAPSADGRHVGFHRAPGEVTTPASGSRQSTFGRITSITLHWRAVRRRPADRGGRSWPGNLRWSGVAWIGEAFMRVTIWTALLVVMAFGCIGSSLVEPGSRPTIVQSSRRRPLSATR